MLKELYEISGVGLESFRRAMDDGYIPTQERITIHEPITPSRRSDLSYRQSFYQLKNGRLRKVTPQNIPIPKTGRSIESVIKEKTAWELILPG